MIKVDPYYDICTLRELYNEFDEDQLSDIYFVSLDFVRSPLGEASIEHLSTLTQEGVRKRLFSNKYTLILIEEGDEQ